MQWASEVEILKKRQKKRVPNDVERVWEIIRQLDNVNEW